MYCVECGSKIEERYKFCPNCGAEVVGVDDDIRNESIEVEPMEETLADLMQEVAREYPKGSTDGIRKLVRLTGLGTTKLTFVMMSVWDGEDPKKMKEYPKMEKQYKGHSNPLACPKCGSTKIQYKEGETLALTTGMLTSFSKMHTTVRCLNCGKQWLIKPNQWTDI